jgi:hypothetical protein
MVGGDADAALACLVKADLFITEALRLLRPRPRAVVAQLQTHNHEVYASVIPILLCPEADALIEGFFRQVLPPRWMRDLFCLWLAKATPDAVLHYIRNQALTAPEVNFITRCLIAAGRLIFTEPFIVWPCGHVLHEKCVVTSLQKSALDSRDATKSCPLCGPVCVALIDRPFEVPKDDAWSMDLGGASGRIVSAFANLL